MAERASLSYPKPFQPSSNPMDPTGASQNPSNPSNSSLNPPIPSSTNLFHSPSIVRLHRMSSPPLSQISNPQPKQQQLLSSASGFDNQQTSLQQQQQQSHSPVQLSQNVNSMSNYQIQQRLQRPSSIPRWNQIQQQQQQQQQSQTLVQQSQNVNSMSNDQILQKLQQSNSIARLTQIQQQQQQQLGVTRQQAGLNGQMNFGGSASTRLQNHRQQQQQQKSLEGSNFSRSELIGQSEPLPMLSDAAVASQSDLLASVQGLPRTSSLSFMNRGPSGLSQSGQPATTHSSSTQQQWFEQMSAVSGPCLPSMQHQRQQQLLLEPQLASSTQLKQNTMALNPQQLSQLVQQQQLIGQPHLQPQPQQQQLMRQPHLRQLIKQQPQQQLMQQQPQQQSQIQAPVHQQQSPMMPGPTCQKSLSLTVFHIDAAASGTTKLGGSSSQGTEEKSQLLGKRKIQDLVAQVDPQGKLDYKVEDILLDIADDFIDSVTMHGCILAKHRKSSTLESKDLLLHLAYLHKNHQDMVTWKIRTLMESSHSQPSKSYPEQKSRQSLPNPVGSHHLITHSLNSEQLATQLTGS